MDARITASVNYSAREYLRAESLRRERDTLRKHNAALLEALRGLMDYVGGWDAPDAHPCGIARDTLRKVTGAR